MTAISAEISSAIDGAPVALTGSGGVDFGGMLSHAREVGGPALRRLTFHERARMLKALGQAIMARKEELYELNYLTGATRKDGWIDIEGGAGTLFSFSSKGRRELPDAHVLLDGQLEGLSKQRHVRRPAHLHPAAGCRGAHQRFQFPGVGNAGEARPDPACRRARDRQTRLGDCLPDRSCLPHHDRGKHLARRSDPADRRRCRRPVRPSHRPGRRQLHRLGADRAEAQANPTVVRESVRFVAEQDSLNASLLGPDAAPGTPEFDLFIKEVATEMTVKAGQKCTAIRRAMAPAQYLDAVEHALGERLARTKVGDPRSEDTRMGALVSVSQRDDVRDRIRELEAAGARIVAGNPDAEPPIAGGAFLSPVLLRTDDPWTTDAVHDCEPFGPVSTIMPYRDINDAIALANRGRGSLVLSLFTHSPDAAREFVQGAAAYHGRMLVLNRDNAAEITGHGSPLPVLVHGGPGRAGGSEEMGGVRGVKHYMQRTAVQSSPAMIAAITEQYVPGAPKHVTGVHPFRLRMSELHIGDTLKTEQPHRHASPTSSISPSSPATISTPTWTRKRRRHRRSSRARVAHGYLILSFAAGLFVDPDPGPVLANTGLENLRFLTPLYPGNSMRVELTVRAKSIKSEETGQVRWAVEVFNQKDELVATYDLLTENVP